MKDFTIGILGGMGTYATIHLFQQYAKVFAAEREWERPRIIIDNRCTMPSRVRAFLYNENVDQLVADMTESMKNLKQAGCTRIILACNTSHLFLPKVYERAPELRENVIDIIETCVDRICGDGVKKTFLLGSEGTIESGIYQKYLKEDGIDCWQPVKEEYLMVRECIEAVKQNNYSKTVKQIFLKLLEGYDTCILGCTELPVLYELYKEDLTNKKIYDPVLLGILKLKEEYENEKNTNFWSL